jgi:hypothetical protein
MTTQNLRLKVSSPSLRLLMRPIYPLKLLPGTGIGLVSASGISTISLDYSLLVELASFDPTQKLFAVFDRATGVWNKVSLASILTGSQTVQIVTAAGDVTVQPNDGLIILNKTVGAATNVNLPAAALKVGDVKIVDWKNDSDVNNITLVPNGAEKINGLTGWKLAGQGASIILKPVSGTVSGYAV